MKKHLILLGIVSLFMTVLFAGSVVAAKTITLKIGAAMPPSSTTIAGPLKFIELVEARTKGQVKFKTFWGGSVAKRGEDLDAVQNGLLDIAVVNCTSYPDRLPLINIQFPAYFSPTDPEILLPLYKTMFQSKAFINDIERYNTKFLFAAPVPGKDVISKGPLKTLDDFKNKKIAAIGIYHPKALKAIGAVPVSVTAQEAYQSLQTGVIDGFLLPSAAIVSYRLFEPVKYVTELGLGSELVGTTVMNRDAWNKLPEDVQKIMEEASEEAYEHNIKVIKEKTEEAAGTMEKAGVTITELSLSEKVKWANSLGNFTGDWVKETNAKGLPGTEMMTLFLETSRKLGYKFPRDWSVK